MITVEVTDKYVIYPGGFNSIFLNLVLGTFTTIDNKIVIVDFDELRSVMSPVNRK